MFGRKKETPGQGNGSDEPIDLLFRVFCEPRQDEALSIAPSYGMYRVAAATNDVWLVEVPLTADFELVADDLLARVTPRTKLIFLCSPNNPSANLLNPDEVEKVIRGFGGIVVLDEAYIDFADHPGFLPRLAEFPNLVVLQTLSKAWGMAGIRIGFAFADPEIVAAMERIKYPYSVNVITERLVLQELEREAVRREQIATLVEQRKRLVAALEKLPLVKRVFPSDANFVLVRFDEPRRVYDRLIERGIIVRDRSRIAGCEGCLRLTVGTPSENDALIDALRYKKVSLTGDGVERFLNRPSGLSLHCIKMPEALPIELLVECGLQFYNDKKLDFPKPLYLRAPDVTLPKA